MGLAVVVLHCKDKYELPCSFLPECFPAVRVYEDTGYKGH